jgi:hypothetical protein
VKHTADDETARRPLLFWLRLDQVIEHVRADLRGERTGHSERVIQPTPYPEWWNGSRIKIS